MLDQPKESTWRLFIWMERLDRWGYTAIGLSLLLVSILLFVYSWAEFLDAFKKTDSFLFSSLTLVNNLLLIIILLELFRTIVRFLETDILRIEPYLVVGIIACIRRMLTASAELGDLRHVPDEFFDKYLKDMVMNAGLVLVLIGGVYLLRIRPIRTDQYDHVPAAGPVRETGLELASGSRT